jgi:hypothetical protein
MHLHQTDYATASPPFFSLRLGAGPVLSHEKDAQSTAHSLDGATPGLSSAMREYHGGEPVVHFTACLFHVKVKPSSLLEKKAVILPGLVGKAVK